MALIMRLVKCRFDDFIEELCINLNGSQDIVYSVLRKYFNVQENKSCYWLLKNIV